MTIKYLYSHCLRQGPGPVVILGLVHAILLVAVTGVDLHVAEPLLDMGADDLEPLHPFDVDDQAEAVDLGLMAISSGVLMLPFPSKEQLRAFKLTGMLNALEQQPAQLG